jgi:hypothetical protein
MPVDDQWPARLAGLLWPRFMLDAVSGRLGVPRLHPKHLQKVILDTRTRSHFLFRLLLLA